MAVQAMMTNITAALLSTEEAGAGHPELDRHELELEEPESDLQFTDSMLASQWPAFPAGFGYAIEMPVPTFITRIPGAKTGWRYPPANCCSVATVFD